MLKTGYNVGNTLYKYSYNDKEAIAKWESRTYGIIRDALGDNKAHFFIGSEYAHGSPENTSEQRLVAGRLNRLQQIINELHRAKLQPSFDYRNWEVRGQ